MTRPMVVDGGRAPSIIVPQQLPGGRWGWPRWEDSVTLDGQGFALVNLRELVPGTLDAIAVSEASRLWRVHIVGSYSADGSPIARVRYVIEEGTAAHGYEWEPEEANLEEGLPIRSVATHDAYGQTVRVRAVSLLISQGVPNGTVVVRLGATIAQVAP